MIKLVYCFVKKADLGFECHRSQSNGVFLEPRANPRGLREAI
jgi:hypothetical protein